MNTTTNTSKRKALRGTIREIEHNCTMSLISAKVDNEDICISSRLPKAELARLSLQIGDTVDIFPIDLDNYLIIGKS